MTEKKRNMTFKKFPKQRKLRHVILSFKIAPLGVVPLFQQSGYCSIASRDSYEPDKTINIFTLGLHLDLVSEMQNTTQ